MHYRGEMRNERPGLKRLQSLRNWDGHIHNQTGSNPVWVRTGETREASNGCSCRVRGGGEGKRRGRLWELRTWKVGRVWKGLGDNGGGGGGAFQAWAWERGLRAGMWWHVPETTGKSVSLERRSVLRIISGDRIEMCRADLNKSWVIYTWDAAGRGDPEYSGNVVMSHIQMAQFSVCPGTVHVLVQLLTPSIKVWTLHFLILHFTNIYWHYVPDTHSLLTLSLGKTAHRRSRFGEKKQELRLGHMKCEKPVRYTSRWIYKS